MQKPPTIVPFGSQPCESVAELTRQTQMRVDSGEFRALAVVGVTRTGAIATWYSFGDDSRPYAALIAGAEIIKKRVIEENK